jgi:hypothetical protein
VDVGMSRRYKKQISQIDTGLCYRKIAHGARKEKGKKKILSKERSVLLTYGLWLILHPDADGLTWIRYELGLEELKEWRQLD